MFRGFLSGLIWGGVLISGVLAVTSLLSPLPATVKPQTTAQAPNEGTDTSTQSGAPAQPSQTDSAVDEAGAAEAPTASGGDPPPLSDTASAPKPETGTAEAQMNAPGASEEAAVIMADGESPVLPSPQAQTPSAPVADSELSISTNPPQPAAPLIKEEGAFPTPTAQAPAAEVAPETPAAEEMAVEEAETALVTEPAATPVQEPEDLTPAAEQELTEEDATASLLKPATNLNESFEQHTSDRLPTVGADATEAEATGAVEIDARPIVKNAEPFENNSQKPVMAIVLVDTGTHDFDIEALESFPYALSIAVSTLDPQAAEKVADYRARGFEVLAQINLPEEASAADVEVAMQAHLSVSDQFVGVMEGLDDGLQSSKEVSDQLTDVLSMGGYGLLMLPNGLNTAQKLAAKEGVPSATVFRDFDDKAQTAVVMRRFLDQAAFKAVQEDGVVMLGRLREEAISALLLWALQDRASTVAIAPISAVLDTIN